MSNNDCQPFVCWKANLLFALAVVLGRSLEGLILEDDTWCSSLRVWNSAVSWLPQLTLLIYGELMGFLILIRWVLANFTDIGNSRINFVSLKKKNHFSSSYQFSKKKKSKIFTSLAAISSLQTAFKDSNFPLCNPDFLHLNALFK